MAVFIDLLFLPCSAVYKFQEYAVKMFGRSLVVGTALVASFTSALPQLVSNAVSTKLLDGVLHTIVKDLGLNMTIDYVTGMICA